MMKTSVMIAASLAVLLSACGQKESTAPTAPATTPAPAAPAPAPVAPAAQTPAATPPAPVAAANAAGNSIYNKVCALCHAAGVGGAPKPGDKADWAPRIAQGKDLLYKHALEGFTGQKGMMPPRGGSPALKDEEVKAAVDFMVSKSE
ncbi:c-type cytochrome [Aromatoleum diolicum]|uniref:C-type cytochrome n=1 Tax=Aromatoleum diolicum TaxID=75796 RepID=A0ABX1QD67_9RHOO|nr:c-type cytochrome [Aromatoleum diolicum]NMG75040.1 c-type cytochrome [Aromatoleum diolicum]